jgi:EmrB/QacA subfamily drug resistance transporter
VSIDATTQAGAATARRSPAAESRRARLDGAPDPLRILALACGATFIAFLDVTVVNLAFTDLQRAFPAVSLANLSWVIIAYAVLFAALMTPGGRLADAIGRRRLFLVGVATFTLASATCAAASNIVLLITARAVQGGAAAAMIPASLSLVLAATPRERMAHAVGLWSASAALAAAAGPTLGGVLVDLFGWRAVFLINVPTGAVILLAGARNLRQVREPGGRLPDAVGTAALTAGIAAVVIGVTKASDWGWMTVTTLTAVGGGLVSVCFALLRSKSHPSPALDIDLWRIRAFGTANVTSLLFGAALYAWLLNMVVFLNSVWAYSPLKAAFAVTPGAISAAAASVLTGRLTSLRARRVAVFAGSMLLTAVGLMLYIALGTEAHFVSVWLPAAVVSGAGMGMTLTAVSSIAATAVDPRRFASAIGLNITGRQLGGALGIAALTTIVQSELGQGARPFRDVFLFCAVLGLASALSSIRLTTPAPPGRHRAPTARHR